MPRDREGPNEDLIEGEQDELRIDLRPSSADAEPEEAAASRLANEAV